jgi:hypothetical protein
MIPITELPSAGDRLFTSIPKTYWGLLLSFRAASDMEKRETHAAIWPVMKKNEIS